MAFAITPRQEHLATRAASVLAAAGTPQSVQALATRLTTGSFLRQAAVLHQLEGLLAKDERFVRDGAGNWALAAWGPATGSATLLSGPHAVIDVGLPAGPGSLERGVRLAGVKLRDGQIVEQYFAQFVPVRAPADGVPQLTAGATPRPLDAPHMAAANSRPASEVLPEFRAWTGGTILIGHEIAAGLAFLNDQAMWLDLPPLDNPVLDTAELAQRLLPDVRPSLSRLAAALGTTQRLRHPALADARLTADVLLALLQRLDQREIASLADLERWLTAERDGSHAVSPTSPAEAPAAVPPDEPASDEPVLQALDLESLLRRQGAGSEWASIRLQPGLQELPHDVFQALPEHPGVYVFRDAEGRVLYVGTAASLRERIAAHFAAGASASGPERVWLGRTAAVDHTPVDCELDALLLAAEQLRTLRPSYKARERARRSCPILRFEGGIFLRAEPAPAVDTEGAFHFGPYRSPQELRHTLETVRRVFQIRTCNRHLPARRPAMRVPCERLAQHLCPAPCADLVSPAQYDTLVEYARLFVTEGKQAALDALQARIDTLAEAGARDAWEFAILEECRVRLLRVRKEYRPLAGGLGGGGLVMAYPTADGSLALFYVQNGRPVARLRISAAEARSPGLLPLVEAHLLAQTAQAELDVDETNVLLRWIFQQSERPEMIPAPAGTAPEGVAGIIVQAARRHHQTAFDGHPA
ncbi:MAG: exonuclease domain-containing protein [Chloroflexota bacterium]